MIPTERKLSDMAYELGMAYAVADGHDPDEGLPIVGYLKIALSSVFVLESRMLDKQREGLK